MKILSVDKIKEADAYTIAHEPIASIDLMERAARQCSQWLLEHLKKEIPVMIFCGTGNNGGDGLAVARHLSENGFKVSVYILRLGSQASPDFLSNLSRLESLSVVCRDIASSGDFPEISRSSYIIDALFGTGLTRKLEGLSAELVSYLNHSGAIIVSIDVPSGLFIDTSLKAVSGIAVQADYTLSFLPPKLCFMMPENDIYVGEWHVFDIGLHPEYLQLAETKYFYITREDVSSWLRRRRRFQHKGDFGHALLIAGSQGKAGAAIMAARACVHSGVGLLTVHAPGKVGDALQLNVNEAMVSFDEHASFITNLPSLDPYDAIGIGPGLGLHQQTQTALKLLLQNYRGPLVMDADALNILSDNKTWYSFLSPYTILTPHPGEFERLVGKADNDFERLKQAKDFALKYNIFLVLKGGVTVTINPLGQCYFNSTGNPGMATGGSGDVLTGIILSLLAQGYNLGQAAVMGVFLHGLAGDLAADELSQEYMSANDIIRFLAPAFLSFSKGQV
ncbi:MAG: NAD(P)HX epimerase / NAD(P)HX dehydratase [Bacteroidetes bacterium 38_7]|nr:MAG: NAD(P)HX epimerase / NAD(P)HX dehydratase [Bacteroidetes bacterium 38_7]HAL64532.1 bifunctional ADP-dependent NAD(P)H-hydrate dehydratase/NAD(P)H-hydrate epimerase [Bacteroidales bacterium]